MKTAWKLCLALALMVAALFVVSVPAFAAGTHTVSGTIKEMSGTTIDDIPEETLATFDDSTFRLYKVGGFTNVDGKSMLVLDSAYGTVLSMEELNIEYDPSESPEWREKWLANAKTLNDYLLAQTIEPNKTATVTQGVFEFSGLDNGLYLVAGDDIIQKDGEKAYRWTPRPMFVVVLNNDVEIGVKAYKTEVEKKHGIEKMWSDTGHENVRPNSVNVTIYYVPSTSSSDDQAEEYRKVTLKKEDNYKYEWEDKEKVNGRFFILEDESQDDSRVKYNYEPTIDEAPTVVDDREWLRFTNTYSRYELKLKKTMPTFMAFPGEVSTTFAFEITGYDGETAVYHTFVGAQFAQGTTEQELTVKDIPRGLSKLTVKEVYSGAYTSDAKEKDATLKTETKTVVDEETEEETEVEVTYYSVDFENTFNTTNYSSGIINRYSKSADAGDFGYTVEQIDFFHKKD